eukprot:COSAG02_NODE_1294_length_13401_cov_32.784393_1_plen_74_part_10
MRPVRAREPSLKRTDLGSQVLEGADLGRSESHFGHFAFRISDISHFAFRDAKPDISHFATRNRTLYISRRETGH